MIMVCAFVAASARRALLCLTGSHISALIAASWASDFGTGAASPTETTE